MSAIIKFIIVRLGWKQSLIKIAIVVGHTERQPGASGVSPIDSSEYAWNSDLAAMIANHVAQVDEAEAKAFYRVSVVE